MLVVNLFGAPGAGKSTGAATIFSELKMIGINAELVTEFAKDKVWEESKAVFEDQVYIFGKQNFRLSRLKNKVDVVVTDSPILLSDFYENTHSLKTFSAFVKEVFDSYNNLNFFIERIKPYNPSGRFQTEEESNTLANKLIDFLVKKEIDFKVVVGSRFNYEAIVDEVVKKIKGDV